MDKKTCFIIMPITTPDSMLPVYNDPDHFIHILNYLFVPILEKMDYEVIKPIAEGSEVIHSKIINNLFYSDLVLCDISISNPNVFFELGIRTALNKQVCIVKDNKTKNIPFDTGLINIHTYDSELSSWKMKEINDELEKHIKSTAEMTTENALWAVFGIDLNTTIEIDTSVKNEIEILKLQNQVLKDKLQKSEIKNESGITATVFRGKPHKCSNCGFVFLVNDLNSAMLGITEKLVNSMSYRLTDIPEQNVAQCPNCRNVEIL